MVRCFETEALSATACRSRQYGLSVFAAAVAALAESFVAVTMALIVSEEVTAIVYFAESVVGGLAPIQRQEAGAL